MTFGERIRQARRAADMSQEGLGKAVGLRQAAVSKWEIGLSEPASGDLRGIAAALGRTVAYLMGETELVRVRSTTGGNSKWVEVAPPKIGDVVLGERVVHIFSGSPTLLVTSPAATGREDF